MDESPAPVYHIKSDRLTHLILQSQIILKDGSGNLKGSELNATWHKHLIGTKLIH